MFKFRAFPFNLGRCEFGCGHVVVHLLFPDLFRAYGVAVLEKVAGRVQVLLVGLEFCPGREYCRGVVCRDTRDADAQPFLAVHEVHERVALAHERAFLDPDAVNLPGHGKPDAGLVDGFRDTVEPLLRKCECRKGECCK